MWKLYQKWWNEWKRKIAFIFFFIFVLQITATEVDRAEHTNIKHNFHLISPEISRPTMNATLAIVIIICSLVFFYLLITVKIQKKKTWMMNTCYEMKTQLLLGLWDKNSYQSCVLNYFLEFMFYIHSRGKVWHLCFFTQFIIWSWLIDILN